MVEERVIDERDRRREIVGRVLVRYFVFDHSLDDLSAYHRNPWIPDDSLVFEEQVILSVAGDLADVDLVPVIWIGEVIPVGALTWNFLVDHCTSHLHTAIVVRWVVER
jgi:hypothetical protein